MNNKTEERQEFYKKFKEANPQTIGETDTAFDNDNFIDYLVSELSQQKEEIEFLKKVRIDQNDTICKLDSELTQQKELVRTERKNKYEWRELYDSLKFKLATSEANNTTLKQEIEGLEKSNKLFGEINDNFKRVIGEKDSYLESQSLRIKELEEGIQTVSDELDRSEFSINSLEFKTLSQLNSLLSTPTTDHKEEIKLGYKAMWKFCEQCETKNECQTFGCKNK